MITKGNTALSREDQLYALLSELPDSKGVLRINREIPNYPSFFPGGLGFKGKTLPEFPVMLIGHNFDTYANFLLSVKRGHENPQMPTWRNFRNYFLATAQLQETDCFFTNFYLGALIHQEPKFGEVRKTTNTGAFPCSRDYHNACVDALRKQVQIVRPRVIGLLGARVTPAFAEAFPAFKPHLGANLRETQAKQPSAGHLLELIPGLQVSIVSLVHPSNPRSIKSHRAQGLILKACLDSEMGHRDSSSEVPKAARLNSCDPAHTKQAALAENIMTKRRDVLGALAK